MADRAESPRVLRHAARSPRTSTMVTSVIGFLVLIVGFLALVWIAQRSLIYFPAPTVPVPERIGLVNVEAVRFTTADGIALNGWFLPTNSPAGWTVLVCNGNAGNRAHRAALGAALRARGVAVLLFDYRGYGENPGSPSEEGLAHDARAARQYLLGRQDVDAARLVYFGESLGAAVAIGLAQEHPPAALILRSPFTSLTDVGRHHYPLLPVRQLLRDRYPSADRIAHLHRPLLIIAGSRDEIVPLEQSRRLFDAATGPKALEVIEGADHNDEALLNGPQMIGAILAFLRRLG